MGGRPLGLASAALVAGAFYGIGSAAGIAAHAALLLCGCALLALLLSLRSSPGLQRLRAPALLCLCAALGVARGALATRPAEDAALFAWLEDPGAARGGREPLLLDAEVLSSDAAPGGARLLLRIDAREARPGARLEPGPASGGLLARVWGPRSLHRGDRVEALARLKLPRRALNPGERDERDDLALRGIALTGTLEESGLRVLERGPTFYRSLDELRERSARRFAAVATTPERGALLAALAVGDRSGLSPALDEELAASGLVHLLSSAGLHLAAVALLVQWSAIALLLRTRFAPQARGASALLALPAALGEVLLLGAPWPALRAGAGALLGLSAPLWARRSDALTALGISAAACALLDPASTHELGLQLSLLGVAGLVLLAGPLRELVPLPLPPLGSRSLLRLGAEKLLRLACATAAASICTAPLLAFAFHRLSLVSVAANALGLWPGLAAVPLATLAVPLDRLAPPLALPLLWAADLLCGLLLRASSFFAALPFASVPLPAPGALTLVAWACLVAVLAGLPAPGLSAALRPRPRTRLLRACAPLLVLLAAFAAEALSERASGRLTATFLAVGQGDAALLRLPDGRTLLIDAGGDLRGLPAGTERPLDAAARTLLPALAELGVRRIDVAVLTHPHPDHAGGLPGLLSRMQVGELWVTGEPGPGDIGGRIAAAARASGVPLRTPRAGLALAGDGFRVEVLQPRVAWDPARSTNDNSLVLRVVHGDVALLFAGDVEALAEAELAQGPAELRADLLKAPHHGSRTSSTDAFLRRVRPRVVVYPVGSGNPFGFPHAEVLTRTRALGAQQLLRTDQGAITAVSDGHQLRVTQRGPGPTPPAAGQTR